MLSTVFTVLGSSIVVFNVLDLNAWHFLPVYLIGAVFGFAGACLRKLPWIMTITGWFIVINTIGILRLILE